MKSRILEEYKKSLTLTPIQREIIVGLLLGDGHLETQNGRTYRLKVEHGVAQKEYVDWLYREFHDWVRQSPRQRAKQSFSKEIVSYGFTTYSSGLFRFYAQQFYDDRKKVVPKLIGRWLTSRAVAIWFMDDGSWKSNHHRTYIIHTLGYRKGELALLVREFMEKFGIKVGIHKQYNGLRLYVYSESAERFKKLVEPYVIPSMRYKLG